MSMTKRYLESLPQAEQDAILGGVDNAYISPDEWTDDAENEPTDEELAEWARALMEENDDAVSTASIMASFHEWRRALIEEDERERREIAPLVRPEGKCVTLIDNNGVFWKL